MQITAAVCLRPVGPCCRLYRDSAQRPRKSKRRSIDSWLIGEPGRSRIPSPKRGRHPVCQLQRHSGKDGRVCGRCLSLTRHGPPLFLLGLSVPTSPEDANQGPLRGASQPVLYRCAAAAAAGTVRLGLSTSHLPRTLDPSLSPDLLLAQPRVRTPSSTTACSCCAVPEWRPRDTRSPAVDIRLSLPPLATLRAGCRC